MTNKEEELCDCECEDPFNVGQKLRLCGQAICLRLHDIPIPKLVILAESDDDDETK